MVEIALRLLFRQPLVRGPGRSPGAWFDPVVVDDPRWQAHCSRIDRVKVHLGPTKIVLVDRSG